VFEKDLANLWDQYLAVIHQREAKLLAYLEAHRTMEEIVEAWIVNCRAREPTDFYEFTERASMQKHLEIRVANSTVAIKDGRYYRIG
jgi:hypothetical protein